jgi:hypothetical protein
MTANRKQAREALAQYFTEHLSSAEAVYAYQVSDFGGKSPVVYITSSGSSRKRLTGRGFDATFILNVHTFVLYPSENTGNTYTERDAEAILDQLEYEIACAVENIQNHALIKAISYDESSNADTTAEIGGETYLHEIIPLTVACF